MLIGIPLIFHWGFGPNFDPLENPLGNVRKVRSAHHEAFTFRYRPASSFTTTILVKYPKMVSRQQKEFTVEEVAKVWCLVELN